MCSDALTGRVQKPVWESAQEGAQPLRRILDRRVGFDVSEAGHGRLSALEVTRVDPVHGRLDGDQIALQCLEFGVVDVGISHAGESTVSQCPPR